MKYKDLVGQNYKMFCGFEGSDYIASEFALETILKIIIKYKIENILELGLGIGSISDTVLKFSEKENTKLNYVGTESNEFCVKAIKSNVKYFDKLKVYPQLELVADNKFDLIIIDGYDKTLTKIVSFCKKNTIIFIEGDRKGQTELIQQIFPKSKHVNIITLNKNKPYAHGYCPSSSYVGGGQLLFINPTLGMKVFWFQQKLRTFMINRIRNLTK
jgi:hypothetical protein